MSGIYDTNKIFVTVVDGTEGVGLYAVDGSINVVVDDAEGFGVYHSCGAIRMNSEDGSSLYDTTGAYYKNQFFGLGATEVVA